MKKVLKTTLVMAALLSISYGVNAQVSVNAGYLSTTGTTKTGGISTESEPLNGVSAGIGYDMGVQGGIGLFWGLNYTYAWKKISDNTKSVDHVLDLPVRVTFGVPVTDNIKVFGFAGPKFVYALAGSTKTGGSVHIKHYGDGLGQRTPFDIKLGLGAGLKFSSLILKAGYDWGMLNQWGNKTVAENSALTLDHLYVTLGLAF
ncbi:MAG: PorT family protein [Prevotellaceae bacterium]|nr:PorT family protein [Prevotellaceae bacterium]